jgi:transcriptional regulator with XRE-family HTH domain
LALVPYSDSDVTLRICNAEREIAHVEQNCKSETVTTVHFDGEKFVAALDSTRRARSMTWRKVADEARVSASTLTRLSQGKRPDVDSLGALSHWAGLETDAFYTSDTPATKAEPLAQITTFLRADPNLSEEGARALEAIVLATYEQFRKK